MKKFIDYSLRDYLNVLSEKTPTPGGGSAAACTAALGAGLISMVARYSVAKAPTAVIEKRINKLLEDCEGIRRQLILLVDRDAEAYQAVVEARRGTAAEKRAAQNAARKVPREVARLCERAVKLTPYLVQYGNPSLVSDVAVAVELLFAAFQSSRILEQC